MSSDIKNTIQKQLDAMNNQINVLRGNKASLEHQLKSTEAQINAMAGAIEVSQIYLASLQTESKVVEMPQKPDAINEDALKS